MKSTIILYIAELTEIQK